MKYFFDCGSNVGQTFDWLKTQPHDYKDHEFYCFEPSPRHFAALIAKAEEMIAKGYRITLCPFGLLGHNDMVPLYEKDDAMGDSLHAWTASDHSPANRTGTYKVLASTRSLTTTIAALTKPGDELVLDIDAEGAEYAMLVDLLKENFATTLITRLFVEFHFIKGADCPKWKKYFIEQFARRGLTIEVRGSVP